MESKEQLKDLLDNSDLKGQLKVNKIIQTLQRTTDIMKAKVYCNQILEGDFSNLDEETVSNLIKAFNNSKINIKNDTDEETFDNKELNLEYELDLEKERRKQAEDQLKKIRKENEKLTVALNNLSLTKTKELIEVSDEDINKLFIAYLTDKTSVVGKAFISGNIIPKTYYKIN